MNVRLERLSVMLNARRMNKYIKIVSQGLMFCLVPMLLLGRGHLEERPPDPTQQKVAEAPKQSGIDPAYLRLLQDQPPLRVQESIVYPDVSGNNWVLNTLSEGETKARWNGLVQTIPPPSPGSRLFVSYGQGALWCPVITEAGDLPKAELFRFDLNLPADGWKKTGTFGGEGGLPMLIVPLKKEDRYLGISSFQGLREPGTERGSFVGVFLWKNGEITLESCIDLPFDDISNITKGKWFNYPSVETRVGTPSDGLEKKPGRFWVGYSDPILLTPNLMLPSPSTDYIALCAASAGVIWILDLENGRVRRTVNLAGLNRNDISKLARLKHVILGTGFAPDGTLIIAAKPPDLIKFIVALDMDNPDSDGKAMREKDFGSLRDEIKEICWWRIDPETGKQERLDSPVDFPERMPTAARHAVFRFLVDPYGHVKTNAFTPWSKVMEAFLNSFPDKVTEAESKKGESLVEVDKNVKPQKTAPPQ